MGRTASVTVRFYFFISCTFTQILTMYYRMCHLKIQTVIQFTSLTQDDGVGLKETVKYGY